MLPAVLAISMYMQGVQAPGSELQRQCHLYVKLLDGERLTDPEEMYDAGQCFGFIGGIAQGLNTLKVSCPPRAATLNTMVRVYLTYVEGHPKVLDFDRSSGAYGAFKQAYPCPKK